MIPRIKLYVLSDCTTLGWNHLMMQVWMAQDQLRFRFRVVSNIFDMKISRPPVLRGLHEDYMMNINKRLKKIGKDLQEVAKKIDYDKYKDELKNFRVEPTMEFPRWVKKFQEFEQEMEKTPTEPLKATLELYVKYGLDKGTHKINIVYTDIIKNVLRNRGIKFKIKSKKVQWK